MKKSLIVLFTINIVIIISLISCDNGYIWKMTSREYKLVEIISISPPTGGTSVAENTWILIEFSHPIDTSTFETSFFLSSNVRNVPLSDYNIMWSNNNMRLTLTPVNAIAPFPLGSNEIYSLTINTNIKTTNGDPMSSNYNTNFATGSFGGDTTPPNLVSNCIQNGVSCVAPSGVVYPVNGIELIFNEAMIPWTVENALSFSINGVNYAPSSIKWYNRNTKVVFNFSNLPFGNAVLNVNNAVALDASGNALSSPLNASFLVATKLSTPTGVSASYTSKTQTFSKVWNGVTITFPNVQTGINITVGWNSVLGATGYDVYRNGIKIGSTVGQLSTTFNESVTFNSVTSFLYSYTIKATNVTAGPSFTSDPSIAASISGNYNPAEPSVPNPLYNGTCCSLAGGICCITSVTWTMVFGGTWPPAVW
ncbi:MAG: Ig-like domain-containing protein [Spirochaetota bacterium]|nr:Ig-like domain-containing protein [Spirochaetota bacterium]